MSRHRADRERPRRRAGWWAAGITTVAVVLLGGVGGTFAFWTDDATVGGDTVTAGVLDLKVDGVDSVTAHADLSFGALLPGNRLATVLTVGNAGTAPLVWTASTTASNSTFAAAFDVKVTADTNVSGTKPNATCPGAALADGRTTLGGSLLSTSRRLEPGASQKICVQLTLRTDADSSLQGQTTTLGVTFNGRQPDQS